MSHYAQIVQPLSGKFKDQLAHLPVCTWVKNVLFRSDGAYTCEVLQPAWHEWIAFETTEDLPAFTDKGRAHRARGVPATLKPGRPTGGGAPTVKPIAFRPTTEQRAWLQKHADKHGVSLSELVRRGMFELGMPR